MTDPEAVNAEFDQIMQHNGYAAESAERRREIAQIAALAQQLRDGEITEREFRAAVRRLDAGL